MGELTSIRTNYSLLELIQMNSTNDDLYSHLNNLHYEAREVYILNQAVQCVCIALIITLAVTLNLLIIHNIWKNELKMHSVNFLLIQNLCLVDFVGSCLVLPFPLSATIKGFWDFGNAACTANSIINVSIWLEHIIMFAMLKIDRVLASCLPIGKYPLISVGFTPIIIISSWVFSFTVASLVTLSFDSSYEPAVVLCIPELPIEFFITIFSIYCLILFCIVSGYIGVLIYLKKKKKQNIATNNVRTLDYKGLERAALTSFLITVSHFLMYVPTMLVIGLHGWFLHPIAILFCDMIVYAEFLIHPTVLFITSTKLRGEVARTVKKLFRNIFKGLWIVKVPRFICYCCLYLFRNNGKKGLNKSSSAMVINSSTSIHKDEGHNNCTVISHARSVYSIDDGSFDQVIQDELRTRSLSDIQVVLDDNKTPQTKIHKGGGGINKHNKPHENDDQVLNLESFNSLSNNNLNSPRPSTAPTGSSKLDSLSSNRRRSSISNSTISGSTTFSQYNNVKCSSPPQRQNPPPPIEPKVISKDYAHSSGNQIFI